QWLWIASEMLRRSSRCSSPSEEIRNGGFLRKRQDGEGALLGEVRWSAGGQGESPQCGRPSERWRRSRFRTTLARRRQEGASSPPARRAGSSSTRARRRAAHRARPILASRHLHGAVAAAALGARGGDRKDGRRRHEGEEERGRNLPQAVHVPRILAAARQNISVSPARSVRDSTSV